MPATETTTFQIAVLPGDGIGVDVTRAGIRVLRALEASLDVFQPAHGTAPDVAGLGIANPVAMILSVAMMLDWLPGQDGNGIRAAVAVALRNPHNRTPDLGGRLTTTQMTDAVLKELER